MLFPSHQKGLLFPVEVTLYSLQYILNSMMYRRHFLSFYSTVFQVLTLEQDSHKNKHKILIDLCANHSNLHSVHEATLLIERQKSYPVDDYSIDDCPLKRLHRLSLNFHV